MVVLAREGDRTVLTMRNDYRGPPEDFALVVPIPTPVRREDVRTLDDSVFDALDQLTAPRLYDYYERDPCWSPGFPTPDATGRSAGWYGSAFGFGGVIGHGRREVEVQQHFAVDEYDIVVLGATDSSALDQWLRAHGYQIPEGFDAAVRPYVERGARFLVARVVADRLELVNGLATLSPLRISYQSEQFELPIRLGLLNSQGSQDLVVHVFARETRYDVASYTHTTIPTHYRVDESVRARFEDFYEALFAQTLARNPGAVVTEWVAEVMGDGAWETGLDPSTIAAFAGPLMASPDGDFRRTRVIRIDERQIEVRGPLDARHVVRVVRRHANELRFCYEQTASNGADVELSFIVSPSGSVQSATASGETQTVTSCMSYSVRRWTFPAPDGGGVAGVTVRLPGPRIAGALPSTLRWGSDIPLVLTRLHMRYGREARDDLVFRPAEPIVGGYYGWPSSDTPPQIVRGARPHDRNRFEARYFIGHDWEGPVSCGDRAVRGAWIPGRRNGEEVIGPYDDIDETGRPLQPRRQPVVLEDALKEDIPEIGVTARVPAEPPEPPMLVPPRQAPLPPSNGCSCRASGSARRAPAMLCAVLLLVALRARRVSRRRER